MGVEGSALGTPRGRFHIRCRLERWATVLVRERARSSRTRVAPQGRVRALREGVQVGPGDTARHQRDAVSERADRGGLVAGR